MTNDIFSTLILVAFIAAPQPATAQAPASTPIARFAAETANLKGGPPSVRIDVFAWSTDTARSRLVDAWNLILPAPATGARGAGTAPAGRGARGARGGNTDTPAAAGPAAPTAGRGARGARGGAATATAGNLGGAAVAAPDTPDKALSATLQSADGIGYLWSSESTGYSLRYAFRMPQPDGSERIVLATDRRLGEWDDSWRPLAGAPTEYGFSIIELRLNAKQEGEGKISLTGKVAIDSSANTIALADYAALPVMLKNVKPRSAN